MLALRMRGVRVTKILIRKDIEQNTYHTNLGIILKTFHQKQNAAKEGIQVKDAILVYAQIGKIH